MNILRAPDRAAVAQLTADHIERFVNQAAPAVLGVATGATMEEPFAEVVRRCQAGTLSLARTEVYLLDEYIGLPSGDSRTFANTVDRLLVQTTDLSAGSVFAPNPHSPDLAAECANYEQRVREAHIGLQLLGIGTNGHIAFNEPGSSLASTTRVVQLSQQTRQDNTRFFCDITETPKAAITQGIATILAAAELLLVACGRPKAHALAQALERPITESVPASALQLHPRLTAIVDPGAASLLGERSTN